MNKLECKWAVAYTISGKTQDDGLDKEQIVALFRYPYAAEDFIFECLPEETRDRFYIKHIDSDIIVGGN